MIDLSLFKPGEIQLNLIADHVQNITVEFWPMIWPTTYGYRTDATVLCASQNTQYCIQGHIFMSASVECTPQRAFILA
ncbi:hypothetical protein V6582_07200 [Agrobacterium vitis]|uniref:hypothetical protein n=1 Tax=Agrobacterium vitis TaxID=373 RepID=UPI0012E83FC5|nr:hypothetical protein [Agrobacterium vitis]MVA24823.1 hypothetical protein [Agrobacterium vitis]